MQQGAVLLSVALCASAVAFVLGRWTSEAPPMPAPATAGPDLTAITTAVEELRREVRSIRRAQPAIPIERTATPESTQTLDERLARIEEALAVLLQGRSGAEPAVAFTRDLRYRLQATPKQNELLLALYKEFGAEDIYEGDSPLTERFRFLTPPEILTDFGRPDSIDASEGAMLWSYEVETTDLVGRERLQQIGADRSFYIVRLTMIGGMVILVTGESEHRAQ